MATVPTLARKVMDADSIFEDLVNVTEDAYTTALEELVEVGYLIAGYDEVEDRRTFYAKEGMSWSQVSGTSVSELSCPVKKQILLCLIENPKTFFVLYNTQKGKMRIAATEMRDWAAAPNLKVVAFLIVDNDKTLADQSADGVTSIVAGAGKVFPLSSNNAEVTLEGIRTHIDAYAADQDGDYPMPVVVALKNPTQMKKVVALMNHIKTKVETRRSSLRYGVVFDEADKIYPQARDQFKPLLVDDNQALHRLGFVTATEGTLMDEDYPECANAYMYPVTSGSEYYRAFHTEDAVIEEVRHYVKDNNDVYAENILRDNAKHFAGKITLANGSMSYRKVIVNSGVKTGSMEGFALRRTAANCYAITVNQNGVTVYRPGQDKVRRSTKGIRFGQLLFNLYGELALHDKPLFIIGRRKVDRGLGFHHAPSDKSAGLVWTDMILGRVDDKNTAVQKAGRLAGIVAHCPQYPGKLTWWTDAGTAAIIKRHNSVVDKTNTLHGCSALQSVARAEIDVPAVQRLRVLSDFGPQIPAIVDLSDEDFAVMPKRDRSSFVLSVLKKTQPSLASTLAGYECIRVNAPESATNHSYKNSVGVATRKCAAREPCSATFKLEETTKGSVWQCFVDEHTTPKRLCFIHVNPPEPKVGAGGGGGPISPE